jgi:hypothetical protein
MAAQSCPGCRYTFSRYLGAVVDEELGRGEEASAKIDETVMDHPNHAWLRREAARVRSEPQDPPVGSSRQKGL